MKSSHQHGMPTQGTSQWANSTRPAIRIPDRPGIPRRFQLKVRCSQKLNMRSEPNMYASTCMGGCSDITIDRYSSFFQEKNQFHWSLQSIWSRYGRLRAPAVTTPQRPSRPRFRSRREDFQLSAIIPAPSSDNSHDRLDDEPLRSDVAFSRRRTRSRRHVCHRRPRSDGRFRDPDPPSRRWSADARGQGPLADERGEARPDRRRGRAARGPGRGLPPARRVPR